MQTTNLFRLIYLSTLPLTCVSSHIREAFFILRQRRINSVHATTDTEGIRYLAEAESFEVAVDTFITHCQAKNLAPTTVKYYQTVLADFVRFIRQAGVNRPLDINEKNMNAAIKAKLDSGVRATTVNMALRGWRAFVRYLYEARYIPQNPAERIALVRTERRIIQTFTKPQIKALLAAADRGSFTGYRNYVILLALLETGARISELLALKTSEINWEDGFLTIFGKGRKERFVPFQATLKKELKRYLNVRGVLNHDFVFVNIDNTPLKKRTVQEFIQDYGVIARIDNVRCSPHTIRHSFAKLYIMNGGDAFSLQKILGHTTLEMVQTYVSLYGVDIAKQHRKYSPLERLGDDE